MRRLELAGSARMDGVSSRPLFAQQISDISGLDASFGDDGMEGHDAPVVRQALETMSR